MLLQTRTGGILKAPPRMVEAISEWLMGVVGTEALRQVAEQREAIEIGGEWWLQTTTGPFALSLEEAGRLRDEKVEELNQVEEVATQLGARPPSGPAPRDYTRTFPLNLTGWPHAAMVEQRLSERRKRDPKSLWFFDQMYDPITVVLYRTLKESRGAQVAATWRQGFLTVWGLPPYLHRVREFQPYLNELRSLIRHELQHLSQDLLREATGVDSAGGLRTRSSPTTEKLNFTDDHALRDVEFHTRLQDAIDGYRGDTHNAALRSYVAAGPVVRGSEPNAFFLALKRNDRRKWERAVSEFVREVGAGPARVAARYNKACSVD